MVHELGWKTFKTDKLNGRLTMLYKIINEIVNVPNKRY